MQSKLKYFVDNYNKNIFDIKKSKFYLEHLLVYFNVELGVSLEKKAASLKNYNISSELLKIKNNVYNGFLLKLYIPNSVTLPTDISYKDEDYMKIIDKSSKTILHIEHLYQLIVLEYISSIYNFTDKKIEHVDFIYQTYEQLDFIVRTNKLNILFED